MGTCLQRTHRMTAPGYDRRMSDRAVVVGAGQNGLAAAIRLAEAGREVCVLEAADAPGGAVRTEELTLPGFRHDTFSAVYPATAASPVFGRMPLDRFGLRWIHPGACYAHPLGEGRAIALYRDVDATAASLDAIQPGDGDAWRAFVEPLLDAWEAIRATMLSGFPPVRGPVKLLGEIGPAGLLRFAGLVPGSAEGLGKRLFGSGDSRAWLYGAAIHGDTPPTGASSAIAVAYLNLLGHAVGWPSPEGGAGRITDALVGYLRSLGGEIRTGARVERVTVSDGRVTGVDVAGDGHVGAGVVVADVMPHALVELTGDALPGTYRSMLRRYRYGLATVKVDWALDGPIPWEAPELRTAGTVHVGGGEDELITTIEATVRGLPERPFLLLGQQSVADPSRAPAGKHTAWAYTHAPNRGIDWSAELDRHVERVEAQVERFAPGFRDRILARHVLGPADLEARDRNLVRGDVGGGSYRLHQVLMRPVPSVSPYRTPVEGLYLGSAATFPGGAVHGVPGDAAAGAALADAGSVRKALRAPLRLLRR
jgi:phytoene dehydrogenase-like protein